MKRAGSARRVLGPIEVDARETDAHLTPKRQAAVGVITHRGFESFALLVLEYPLLHEHHAAGDVTPRRLELVVVDARRL